MRGGSGQSGYLIFGDCVLAQKNPGRGGFNPSIVPGRQAVDACQIEPRRPAWPRRGAASALRGKIRNAEIRIHASGLDRRASNPKPNLGIPDRNCRTIGTLLTTITLRRVTNLAPLRCSSTESVRYPQRNSLQNQWLSRVTGRVSLPTRKSKSAPWSACRTWSV